VKGTKRAHLLVRVAGRRLTARGAGRRSRGRGYAYFALVRAATSVSVRVTARGFATYSATFKVIRHGHGFRLKRLRPHHSAPSAPVPDEPPDDPTGPVAGQPPAAPPPHSDNPP